MTGCVFFWKRGDIQMYFGCISENYFGMYFGCILDVYICC